MGQQKKSSLREAEFVSGIRLVRGVNITHDFPRHVHQSMLFVWVTGGFREMNVQGQQFRIAAGQGFCLPSECAHTCRSLHPHNYYAVSVPPHVCEVLDERDVALAAFALFNEDDEGNHALRNLVKVLRLDPDPMAIHSALLNLLAFVQPGPTISISSQHLVVVNCVRDYLQSNFSSPVRLSDLAALTGWSAGMVNRIFRAHIGVPPYEFLLQQRLREAARLLRNGTDSLADIAAATGFSDQSHMQRLFRRSFGVTPRTYRQDSNPLLNLTPAAD